MESYAIFSSHPREIKSKNQLPNSIWTATSPGGKSVLTGLKLASLSLFVAYSNSLLSFFDIKNRLETLASIFASPANLQNFACHAVFVVFPEQKFRDHSLAFSVLPSVCCCCCSVIDHPSIRRKRERGRMEDRWEFPPRRFYLDRRFYLFGASARASRVFRKTIWRKPRRGNVPSGRYSLSLLRCFGE